MARKMNAKEYRLYLASPKWKALRKLALDRAGHRCQLCNVDAPSLQVHHRTYERLGNESLDDLTVLCGPCHKRHHRPVAPRNRGERRREIADEILEIVETSGLIAWRDVRKQIKAPRTQSWAICQRLLKRRELAWKYGKLCLYSKQETVG